MNYIMIVGADYTKSQGKSVGDFAKYLVEEAKVTWEMNIGFKSFVSCILHNWESYRPH